VKHRNRGGQPHRSSGRGRGRAKISRAKSSQRTGTVGKSIGKAPAAVQSSEIHPPIRLGFARGVAPSKWAERWRQVSPHQPLELVPFAAEEYDITRDSVDVLLERVAPDAEPDRSFGTSKSRHAVRLYEESIALVLPADHELSALTEISVEDLASIRLLDHPDHAPAWPPAEAWAEKEWMPRDAAAALALVATGLGGILLAQPLARHLSDKHAHAVLLVDRTASPLSGSSIWASWQVERDADDVQHFVGMLRGRTARSSR
jgi:DNA-binding transcriptional LysR family regulator